MAFDDKGNMYIAEGGYSYDGLQPQPRMLKVQQNGNTCPIISSGKLFPEGIAVLSTTGD
jgi:hypothetical protein